MSKGVSGERGADESALPEPARRVVRTVTPPFRGHADAGTTTIGIAYFLGMVVLLIPFLPFVAIVWGISKVTGSMARKAPTERLPDGGPGSRR